MTDDWRPTHDDPLLILAMDHRDSFGSKLFGVENDEPTDDQLAAMTAAKVLIYEGLRDAAGRLEFGRPGCLVDEQYGQRVIDAIGTDGGVELAVPIEASGHDWFTLQWGDDWLEHVQRIGPRYAKVLVRDNPTFDADQREAQFAALADVSRGLHDAGVPLLYELLVPATDEQLASVRGDKDGYDRDVRPDLVVSVLAQNQEHGIEPALWKVEGLDTLDAARRVAGQARADGRDADLIVLGRDAPAERLNQWLEIASQVPAFVGFAIGRSIWEDVVSDFESSAKDDAATEKARAAIADSYLGFTKHWAR